MIKVLVVANQAIHRAGLMALLQNYDEFEVLGEASDLSEGLEKTAKLKPDIVIIDMYIEIEYSIEAIKTIRRNYPAVKVIILSASESDEDFFQALNAGASAYVLKTDPFSELTHSIRVVAEGESAFSAAMVRKLVKRYRNEEHTVTKVLNSLSSREIEILSMAARGDSNKEIASQCFVSETTVKSHFRNILGKLEVKNRTGAVAIAITKEII